MSRLFWSLVFCLFSLSSQAQTAREFAQKYLQPLIGDRQGLYKISFQEGDPARITLLSTSNNMILGRYEIVLSGKTTDLPKLAPHLNLVPARAGTLDYVQMQATLELPLNPAENPTPLLRSLLRSDFLLHPAQTPPGREPKLTPVQWNVIQQIEEHIATAEDRDEMGRSIVILPPGFGKTVIAGQFLKREFAEFKEPYKIFFVVQNKDILDEAAGKLQTILKLKPAEVLRAYGEGSREDIAGSAAKLIATTRTTLFRNLDEILAARQDFRGRVAIVFDEAHHTGKVNGEFDAIVEQFKTRLKKQDLILGLTATPWHNDSDIIQRLFHNNVATALLSAEERQQFLVERRLIYMSRLMLFRAMAEGYLSPIHSYRQVRYLEREGELPILARGFLNEWVDKFIGLDENERMDLLKREIVIHYPLIGQMVKEIQHTVKRDGAGKMLIPNRGIVFVPSIAHANIYAFLLNQRSPKGEGGIYAKPYHSELDDDTRAKTMDWFRDQEVGEGSSFRRTDRISGKKAVVHKYLFAIRALGEGVDEPRVNHIMLAKPYSEEDQIGMRDLIQNLGRGSRLSYPKPDFTVSDFTGDMQRLIFSGLDRALVDRFFVKGGEQDFAPQPPEEDKPKKEEPSVLIDFDSLKPEQFTTDAVVIPERHFSAGAHGAAGVLDTPYESVFGPEPKKVDGENRITWREFLEHPASLHMTDRIEEHYKQVRAHWAFDYSRSSPARSFYTLNELFGMAAKEWIQYFSPGGVKKLTRTLRHLHMMDEWGQMTTVLRENLDRPTPWSRKDLDEVKGFFSRDKAQGPSLKQAMSRLVFEKVRREGKPWFQTPLKWGEVLGNPAFMSLLALEAAPDLSTADRNSILKNPTSLNGVIAADTLEFQSWYPTPLVKHIRHKLIEAGLHGRVPLDLESTLYPILLLELPDALVWLRTEETRGRARQGSSDVTIRQRLQRIVARGSERELSDYAHRVSVALGYYFKWTLAELKTSTLLGEWENSTPVGRAFLAEGAAAAEGDYDFATWREVLESPEMLRRFRDQTGLHGGSIEMAFYPWAAGATNLLSFINVIEAVWLRVPNMGRVRVARLKKAIEEIGLGKMGSLDPKIAENLDGRSPFLKIEIEADVSRNSVRWRRRDFLFPNRAVPSLKEAVQQFEATVGSDPALAAVSWGELFRSKEGLRILAAETGRGLWREPFDRHSLSIEKILSTHPVQLAQMKEMGPSMINRLEMVLAFYGLGSIQNPNPKLTQIKNLKSPFSEFHLYPSDHPQKNFYMRHANFAYPQMRPPLGEALGIARGGEFATWREVFESEEAGAWFLENLNLSVRTRNSLMDHLEGRKSIFNLVMQSDRELLLTHGFGRRGLIELEEELAGYGLAPAFMNPLILQKLDRLSPFRLVDGKVAVDQSLDQEIRNLTCEENLKPRRQGPPNMID